MKKSKVLTSLIATVLFTGICLTTGQAEGNPFPSKKQVEIENQVAKEMEIIELELNKIYEFHLDRVIKQTSSKLEEENKSDFSSLSEITKQELDLKEALIEKERQKEIDKVLEQNGWIKVNNNDDERVDIASTSGQLKLTNDLYYNEMTGYFHYRTDWNFDDSAHDTFVDTTDILAIRSSNDVTSRSAASIYSYDQLGVAHHTRVSRMNWDAKGVIFNVHDYSPTNTQNRTYWTDNGYATFTFLAPANSEIYTHFEHNFQSAGLTGAATIDLLKLTNSQLTVSYSKSNKSWQTVSNPQRTF